tara:strand:- start:311 stop:484 length:174 start_codon:yes stop_codon:yes gene_type:complete
MRKVIDYVTIFDWIVDDFDSRILMRISDGYELYGSPYSGAEYGKLFNFQAMVKHEDS